MQKQLACKIDNAFNKKRGPRGISIRLLTKRLEKQRQMDLQRQDLHPEQVQATLRVLAHEQPVPPSSPQPSGLLPPAIPEDDAEVRHVVPVRIRKWRSTDE